MKLCCISTSKFCLAIFIIFFISCKKKENNPFPAELFRTRNWHHITHRRDSLGVDTILGKDVSGAVQYIDPKHVSFNSIKFYCQGGNEPMGFKGESIGLSVTYRLDYFASKDSIAYESFSTFVVDYLLSF